MATTVTTTETNTVDAGTAVAYVVDNCEFPLCGILDDFNRSNRVLDGDWENWDAAYTMPNISSNQVVDNDAAYKADFYYTVGFVAPCQYYYDLVSPQLDFRWALWLTTTDTWDDVRLLSAEYHIGGNWRIHYPDDSFQDVGNTMIEAIGVLIEADNTISMYIKRGGAWEFHDTYNLSTGYGYDIADYTNIEVFMYNSAEDAHIKMDNFGGCNL